MQGKKSIHLNITGEQSLPTGDVNHIEMDVEGCYYEEAGVKFIEYYEKSEHPGKQFTYTQLSIADDVISLLRHGENLSHMVFKEGMRSMNVYSTPIGAMEMNILPLTVQADVSEEKGNVALEYQMDVAGHYAGFNALKIRYRAFGHT